MQPRRRAALFLLILAVLLPHWPAGRVDFVYDDEDFIVANPAVHSAAAAARAFFEPFPLDQPARRLYRPVTALSYGVDFTLWGGDARGFAYTNMVLYLIVVLLAWRFLSWQLHSPSTAFLAAMFFAVHPVHAEAVDAIAGRSELLALLFALLSIRWYQAALGSEETQRGRNALPAACRPWFWPLASALAYALACGAKETAVVLPGVLACLGAVRLCEGKAGQGEVRRALLPLLPHLSVLAAYLIVRRAALGGFLPVRTTLGGVDFTGRVLTAGSVFLEYLRLLLFPVKLQIDGYYLARVGITRAPTPRALVGLTLLAVLVSIAGVVAARIVRRDSFGAPPAADERFPRRALLGGLAFFFIFLLPVGHLLPMGALMAERFLFAPSLGFVLAGAAACRLLWLRLAPRLSDRRRRAARLAGGCALLVLAGLGGWRTHARAREWRDAVRLWQAADRDIPGSYLVKTNLAAEMMQRGDLAGAERALLEALTIRPQAPEATYNLELISRTKAPVVGPGGRPTKLPAPEEAPGKKGP